MLPGAKVKKDAPTTESYLRHYPNPAVRAHPGHDYHDSIMKQRVADTMLHKVVGQDADSGRVSNKNLEFLAKTVHFINHFYLGFPQAIQLANWSLLQQQY